MHQICEDTGCSPEDLPKAMNDREKWRERVRDICAEGTTWWWWCTFIHTNHIMFAFFLRVCLQLIVLQDQEIGLKQELVLRIIVDQGVIVMKRYSTFPNAPEQEPHHQIQFNVIPRTFCEHRCTHLHVHPVGPKCWSSIGPFSLPQQLLK